MDQSRPDLSNNPQQNVHLYMHHICPCQNLYPSTYYPTINYRTPSLISYTPTAVPPPPIPPSPTPTPTVVSTSSGGGVVTQPQTTVTRPFVQHYQYTEYNVGNQYNLPTAHNHCNSGCSSSNSGSGEIVVLPQTSGSNVGNRGERGDSQEQQQQQTSAPPPPAPLPEFEFGLTIPPMHDFFVMNNNNHNNNNNSDDDMMEMNADNFIKFLERSCLIAENIAYKNRARPCFRNIQNLCIRTRTEILKQRTTLANLRSQGIPWATKDFIYAFIRLINCWHILKGYWENRNLINLNKIEKQLTPTFKTCYKRWERETCQLATELTRIFYNLDFNNSNNNNSEETKTTTIVGDMKKIVTTSETTMTDNVVASASSETVDQANQTNFDNDEIIDDNSMVYIKSGIYFVSSKNKDATTTTTTTTQTTTTTTTNPCVIEFLETAQNVDKGLEAMNDKYRIKLESSIVRKITDTTVATALGAAAATTGDDVPANNTTDDDDETEVDWWSSL